MLPLVGTPRMLGIARTRQPETFRHNRLTHPLGPTRCPPLYKRVSDDKLSPYIVSCCLFLKSARYGEATDTFDSLTPTSTDLRGARLFLSCDADAQWDDIAPVGVEFSALAT